jgi:hypothetical protein
MVERMLMVLVGIMVSQPMLLLVKGDAGVGERFVEPKLLLKCSGLDCSMYVEEGRGSNRLKGGMALAPDLVLKKLRGLLRLMFLIGLDPSLWDGWLSRLVNVFWLGVSSAPMSGPTADAPLLR